MIKVSLRISEYEFRTLSKSLNDLSIQEIEMYDETLHPLVRLVLIQIFQKKFAGKKVSKVLNLDIIQVYALWFSGITNDMIELHHILLEMINTHNAELEKAGILIRKPPKQQTAADYQQQFDDVFHDLEETYNKLPLEKIEGYELRKEN